MDSHNLDKAATHALNGLPAEEAASFEESLGEVLQNELASFRRVAIALTDGLPDIVPAASPELWDRISEQAGITPPPPAVPKTRRPRFRIFAAAALIAVAAVGAISLLATRPSATDTRSLAVAAAASTDSLQATLLSPNGVEAIHPEVVIAADGTGYIIADTLPQLADSRTYQLWLIVDDKVISAGLLGSNPDVVQFRAEGNISGIAISNEVAGGVVVSEVTPTALWLSESL